MNTSPTIAFSELEVNLNVLVPVLHFGLLVFVGSGIFKSEDPATPASAIVMSTHHFNDPSKVTEASAMMAGKPMDGLEIDKLEVRMEERGW